MEKRQSGHLVFLLDGVLVPGGAFFLVPGTLGGGFKAAGRFGFRCLGYRGVALGPGRCGFRRLAYRGLSGTRTRQ